MHVCVCVCVYVTMQLNEKVFGLLHSAVHLEVFKNSQRDKEREREKKIGERKKEKEDNI